MTILPGDSQGGRNQQCRVAPWRMNVHTDFFSGLRLHPPKTNMDTQNDSLEKVTPFKYGNFWYLY